MSTTGSRNVFTGQKNRTLTGQSERAGYNGGSGNYLVTENANSRIRSPSSVRRAPTKSLVSPTSYKRPSTTAAGSALRLESQYTMKRKRYETLTKELKDKQKLVQDLYNDMSQLRDKVLATGAKDPGKPEELKFETASTKQRLPASNARTSPDKEMDAQIEKFAIAGECVESFESRLRENLNDSQDACQKVLEKQSALLTFVEPLLKTIPNKTDQDGETSSENSELMTQLEAYRKDHDSSKARFTEMQATQTKLAAELIETAYSLCEQFESCRSQLKEAGQSESLRAQLNAVEEELRVEREASNQGRERLRQAEIQVQKARAKIRELETHLASDEGKIQELQTNIKSMDAHIRQKDQVMDQRMKDMQKTMKNNEGLVNKVEKQRDSFESRLVELKEMMGIKEAEANSVIKELKEKLKASSVDVDGERDKRQQAEDAFAELEERYKNLEEKSKQLCELAEKSKDFTITDGNHTENEVRLFNELQALQTELAEEKERTMQLQKEKEEIVAVMHQAASRDEEEDTNERLAAELVFKSDELKNLMLQYVELKKEAKNAQERSGILEKQLIDIQTRLHSQSKEGGKAGLSAHAIELQQQVSDLRNNLAEALQQKEELETALTQKQLELEQRDRVMREQSKFLKVRDELLGLLKGKNQQENGELSNSDENSDYMNQINEQVAEKTEAIQELYATLEGKQLQILRLEKMVKLMENQQDRAQAQRTRLENRIAQLELALHKNKEYRSKGFGIL